MEVFDNTPLQNALCLRGFKASQKAELDKFANIAAKTSAAYEVRRSNQNGVSSLHVDDIKFAADPEISTALIDTLTKRFGALKAQDREYAHCGLMHVQQEDGTVEIHQNHYLNTVVAPSHDKLNMGASDQNRQ
eukprot:6458059-Amphidinium_carterae.1